MNPTTSCATSCSGDPTEACGGTETQLSWFKMINVRNIGTPCTPCEVVNTATGFKKAAHCKGSFYPPYTRKGFWASEKLPFLFFKCEKGICQGGSAGYLQDGADLDPFGRSIVLGKCGPFAKGVMCAGCLPGSFKKGKQCMACPPSDWGFVLYTIAPVIMVLGWMPFIYWFVGGGIGPSLFISYAYFQISAAVGGFACEWPDIIRLVLGNLGTPSCHGRFHYPIYPFSKYSAHQSPPPSPLTPYVSFEDFTFSCSHWPTSQPFHHPIPHPAPSDQTQMTTYPLRNL